MDLGISGERARAGAAVSALGLERPAPAVVLLRYDDPESRNKLSLSARRDLGQMIEPLAEDDSVRWTKHALNDWLRLAVQPSRRRSRSSTWASPGRRRASGSPACARSARRASRDAPLLTTMRGDRPSRGAKTLAEAT